MQILYLIERHFSKTKGLKNILGVRSGYQAK